MSRFIAQPSREYWKALKVIFRYLAGIVRVRICYGQKGGADGHSNISKEGKEIIEGFVDVDFDRDVDTRYSTTDFVFSLYGGPISWRSYNL